MDGFQSLLLVIFNLFIVFVSLVALMLHSVHAFASRFI